MIEVTDKFLDKSLDVTLKLASFEMDFMKVRFLFVHLCFL